MHRQLDENVFPVPQPVRRMDWIHIRRKLFTVDQCEELVHFAETSGRYRRSGGRGSLLDRDVEISYLLPKHAPWAYEKISAAFARENIWGFVLSAMVEPMRIQRYRRGGYTRHHTDYDYASTDQSKITAIVPLVKRASWEGGEFILRGDRIPKTPDQGDCLFFPSFACHGLSPVTKGVRIVLSAWVSGPRLV